MTFDEELAIVKEEFETNSWITETACHKAWESACERARDADARYDMQLQKACLLQSALEQIRRDAEDIADQAEYAIESADRVD